MPKKHMNCYVKPCRKKNVVAVAKTVIGTKETLLALCPSDEEIIVETLFYMKKNQSETPKTILHPDIDKAGVEHGKTIDNIHEQTI